MDKIGEAMNLEDIDGRLRRVITETFNLDRDHPNKLMEQNKVEKWDSMGHLFLILAIEKEFGVTFKTDRIPELTSFDLLKYEIVNGSFARDN